MVSQLLPSYTQQLTTTKWSYLYPGLNIGKVFLRLQNSFALVLVFQFPMGVAIWGKGRGEDELLYVEVLLEGGHTPASLIAVEERFHVGDLDVSLLLVQFVSLDWLGV